MRTLRKLRQFLVVALALVPAIALLLPLSAAPVNADSNSLQKISAALLAQMASNPLQRVPVIVELNPATLRLSSGNNAALAQIAVAILQANGQAVGGLPLIEGAAGYANAAGIQAMSLLPQVASIEQDAVVRPRRPANSGTSVSAGQLTSLYPQEINAARVWSQGGTGRGVTVAVLDSGVAADPDLGSRIVASVSFVGSRDPNRPDVGGHGTHIAGTIAGDGTRSAGQFVGIAPRANIADVQVLDGNGNGRISSILRGLEWVLAHQGQFNIRVVNLSFGAIAQGSYKTDPLAAGVEIAAKHGLVVVAAAGNGGPASGTVESPAIDPYVLSVGSTDDQGTLSLADDALAWFSSWGTPTDSTPKPELVGPGRRLVSIRVPGSTLDQHLPDHVVTASNGSTYFRLTGTSMATAVVSGAAALLLERQPNLTPDQVKKILVSVVQPFGVASLPPGAGAGLLDAYAATNSPTRGSANRGLRPADSLARGLYAGLYGQPLAWKSLTYLGSNWAAVTWPTVDWNPAAWDNIAWDNMAWDNIAWDNGDWDNIAWDNIAWDNIAWDNIAWDNIAWDNSGWNNIAWDSFAFD
jgi:serine protease AprX